jgi:uncharacterized membrane protein
MAQRTIARLYDSYEHASSVVSDLEVAGIPQSDISLVANDKKHTGTSSTNTETATGAGALLGTAVGGGVGLLAGIGALAIPGVGPVVAAGWLVATLTGAGIGAASGGLLGALTGAGINQEEAHVYAEGVKGGGSLVTVRVDEADAARVEEVLGRHGPVDWRQRRAEYGADRQSLDENAGDRVREYAGNRPGVAAGPDVPVGSDVPAAGVEPTHRS